MSAKKALPARVPRGIVSGPLCEERPRGKRDRRLRLRGLLTFTLRRELFPEGGNRRQVSEPAVRAGIREVSR